MFCLERLVWPVEDLAYEEAEVVRQEAAEGSGGESGGDEDREGGDAGGEEEQGDEGEREADGDGLGERADSGFDPLGPGEGLGGLAGGAGEEDEAEADAKSQAKGGEEEQGGEGEDGGQRMKRMGADGEQSRRVGGRAWLGLVGGTVRWGA